MINLIIKRKKLTNSFMIFVSQTDAFKVLTSVKTDLTAPGLAQTVLSVLIAVWIEGGKFSSPISMMDGVVDDCVDSLVRKVYLIVLDLFFFS